LEAKVKECNIIYSLHTSGRPIGTFSCACGFIYSRTGPDASKEDRWKRWRIIAFGPVWEKKLGELWMNEMLSLRAIARKLGVDPLTIKRQATRMGLSFPRPVRRSSPLNETRQLRPRITRIPGNEKLESYRAVWIATLQNYPDIGIKALRSKVPGVYTWLYRHDKIWLKEHIHAQARKNKICCYRVDWVERDAQLAEEVKIAAYHLKNLPGRPVHITISAIAREIGQLSLLQQHLDKLPRTGQVLKEHVESREIFAVRRVQWAAMDCCLENVYLERWQFIRKAGVVRLAEQPQVKGAIDAALELLSSKIGDFGRETI